MLPGGVYVNNQEVLEIIHNECCVPRTRADGDHLKPLICGFEAINLHIGVLPAFLVPLADRVSDAVVESYDMPAVG